MMMRGAGTDLRVQAQGRAYAAVIGVTVGMLVAGLAVPLAFGQVPGAKGSGAAAAASFGPGSAASDGATAGPSDAAASAAASASAVAAGAASSAAARLASGSKSSGRAASGPLTASDQGVTPTTVKVGVVLLDIQALAPLGFSQPHFSPQEQQKAYQVFIDQANKAGGMAGRQLTADFVTYNPLDTSGSTSGAAVCSKLAQDDKVFAVVGVLDGNIAECLTEQFGIPAIANVGHIAEAYSKGHNLLVSPHASLERGAKDWGDLAVKAGVLSGRKVATVSMQIPQEDLPEQALVGALSADGQSVAYRSKLSSDQASSQSQMPIEIQKMRSAGVNTVFLVTNFITALQFVQTANSQGFAPQYIVSDLGSLTAEGLVSSMPSSFNGALAFTQGNPASPEPAEDAKCRTYFNSTTGLSYGPGTDTGIVRLACWMVKVLTAGGNQTGANLTRPGMAQSFQQLGSMILPYQLGGAFGPGKTDYGDYWRPETYATSCKCYQASGGAQKGRY